MAVNIPDSDSFVQGVAALTHPLEYLRGGVASPTYTDADPHLVYSAADGYARFEDGITSLALYRRLNLTDLRAKIRFQHKRVSGAAGADRFTGIILRAAPSGVTASATTGQTDYFTGVTSGYLIRVQDNGAPLVGIYRIVGNSLFVQDDESVACAENTWHTLEARVRTNASTGYVEITVLLNGVAVTGMNPFVDSGASRVLTAGMVGIQGTAVNGGGNEVRSIFDYFEVQTYDGATEYLEDDFQRPSTTLITAGGKVHAGLMWEFGDAQQISGATGSTLAPGYLGNMLAIQPGAPAGPYIGPWADLYQRTPPSADQTAGIRARFDASALGAGHEIGVILKGSKSAAGTGIANLTGYVGLLRLNTNGLNSLVVTRYSAGTGTVLHKRDWPVSPDKWYSLELSGAVNGAGYDLVLRIGQGLLVSVISVNDPTALPGVGLMGIYGRCYYAAGAAGTILVNRWYSTAAAAASIGTLLTPHTTFETLAYEPEYVEALGKEWTAVAHDFDSLHVQSFSAMRQGLFKHRAHWLRNQTDAEAVRDFLLARAADAAPFEMVTSVGTKRFLLVSPVVPFSQRTVGVYTVGPVDLLEYIEPTSTP